MPKSTEVKQNPNRRPADHLFGFATPEHKRAGDAINLPFLDEQGSLQFLSLQDTRLKALDQDAELSEKKNCLSYGDILALAGDYYALADAPIAEAKSNEEAKQRFIAAFNSLANSTEKETKLIFDINNTRYSRNSSINEYIKQFKFLRLLGKKYFSMTNNNLDHFQPWSKTAYDVGHQVALEMAKKAHTLLASNYLESKKYLILAYQMNAFACHFLSDSFSSGHLRLGKLREKLSQDFGIIGGILVNNMHNEDSTLGVDVFNQANQEWRAFGDDNYLKAENKANRNIQYQALQLSAQEIFQVYEKGQKLDNNKVDDYLPQVKNSNGHIQNAPMFKLSDKNELSYRDPINELNPDKVKYKKLTRYRAFVLAVKLRLFFWNSEAKFTAKDPEVKINNVYSKIKAGDTSEQTSPKLVEEQKILVSSDDNQRVLNFAPEEDVRDNCSRIRSSMG